jgi:hypothetical protein
MAQKAMNQAKSRGKLKLKLKLKTPDSTKLKTPKAPPKQTQCKLSLLDSIYHVSSLNHLISKKFNQLCAQSLPLWQ